MNQQTAPDTGFHRTPRCSLTPVLSPSRLSRTAYEAASSPYLLTIFSYLVMALDYTLFSSIRMINCYEQLHILQLRFEL
jgi:hypothetical protein